MGYKPRTLPKSQFEEKLVCQRALGELLSKRSNWVGQALLNLTPKINAIQPFGITVTEDLLSLYSNLANFEMLRSFYTSITITIIKMASFEDY